MLWSSSRRLTGAFRYQSSLNAFTESAFEESVGHQWRCRRQHAGRVREWETIAGPGLLGGGEAPTGEHGPARGPTPGHEVDPRDRVVVPGVTLGHQPQDLVEVPGAIGVDEEPARLDPGAPEGRVDHRAGEAHTAGGRPEELGITIGSDLDDLSRGELESEGVDVVAPRALVVVVLAVDVGGDGTSDRDVPRPRGDGHEGTLRDEREEQPIDAGPGLGGDRHVIGGGVGGDGEGIDVDGLDHHPPGVLGGVAVAAPEPPGDHPSRVVRGQSTGQLSGGCRPPHV